MRIKDLIARLSQLDQDAEILYVCEHHLFKLEPADIGTSLVHFRQHPNSPQCHIITQKIDENCSTGLILHY